MTELPLSWTWQYAPHRGGALTIINDSTISLPYGRTFVGYANVKGTTINAKSLLESVFYRYPEGFVLRGVSTSLSKEFENAGCIRSRFGCEAVIDLDKIDYCRRPSLKRLVERGKKRYVYKWGDKRYLRTIRDRSPRLLSVPLKGLFRRGEDAGTRIAYAMDSLTGLAVAFISVSYRGEGLWQIEEFARVRDSRVGVMEALMDYICCSLQDLGARFLSLGEVPFIGANGVVTNIERRLAVSVLYPTYNVLGLFRFKAKFAHVIKPLWWVGYPSLSKLDLLLIAGKCNVINLSFHNIFSRVFKKLRGSVLPTLF